MGIELTMKILFVGNVQFSFTVLEAVLEKYPNEIAGVITKSKSSFNADHTDLAPLAEAYNIPYKYVKDINAPHICDWIREIEPDYIFCFGWSSLLSNEVLSIPKKASIGYHPAALPNNRGRHPLIWTLVLGLEHIGSSFFKLEDEADSGAILSQKLIPVEFKDDAASVYNKLTRTAVQQVLEFIPQIANGSEQWTETDSESGNSWRKRGASDGKIDFRMPTLGIYNLVRGLTKPYIGAEVVIDGQAFKVWKSEPGANTQKNLEPGKVLRVNGNAIEVKTGDASIVLLEHEIDVPVSVNDYFQ